MYQRSAPFAEISMENSELACFSFYEDLLRELWSEKWCSQPGKPYKHPLKDPFLSSAIKTVFISFFRDCWYYCCFLLRVMMSVGVTWYVSLFKLSSVFWKFVLLTSNVRRRNSHIYYVKANLLLGGKYRGARVAF